MRKSQVVAIAYQKRIPEAVSHLGTVTVFAGKLQVDASDGLHVEMERIFSGHAVSGRWPSRHKLLELSSVVFVPCGLEPDEACQRFTAAAAVAIESIAGYMRKTLATRP